MPKEKMPKHTILQQSWVWPDFVTSFVKDRVVEPSLNVCSGVSKVCTVNLDLDPKDKDVLMGDMRCLPFPAGTFETVVSDVPWKISYYERFKPFFECVRVAKIGGMIIYNATWIPSSTDTELQEVWVRQDNAFSTASIISIHKKVKDNPKYELAQEKLLEKGVLVLATPEIKKG
jgi:hypothetical protein